MNIKELGRKVIKMSKWKKKIIQILAGLVLGAFAGFLFVTISHHNAKVRYYQSFGGTISDYVKCDRVSKEELNISDKGLLVEMECPFGTRGLSKNVQFYAPRKRRIGIYYSPQGRSWNSVVLGNASEITVVRSDLKFIGLQNDKYTPNVVIFKEKEIK